MTTIQHILFLRSMLRPLLYSISFFAPLMHMDPMYCAFVLVLRQTSVFITDVVTWNLKLPGGNLPQGVNKVEFYQSI